MFKLDLQSRLPIYEQLKARISELVMLGELGPDNQLPSVRNVARDLGINPNTVQKAYQDLERDGIIYSVAGRGSYISPNINWDSELQRKRLNDLQHAARRAKSCGITKTQALQGINKVYEEDEHDSGQ